MAKKTMRKAFNSFKALSDSGNVFIEGWANKAVVDDVGDLMAFDAVDLTRFKKNPILLYNHNRDVPIGKIVDIQLSEEGLWIKAQLSNSDDPMVSYVRDLTSEGILKTFSIGFDPQKEERNPAGYNEIKQWRLNEISIVTLPANIEAEFALTKQLESAANYSEAKSLVLTAMEGSKMAKKKPDEEMPKEPKKPEQSPETPPEDPAKPDEEPKKPFEEQKSAFQECVSAKIPKLIEEGRAQDQAIAIAFSMCSQEGKCSVDVMTPEMFEAAKQIALACEKPEKKEKAEVATPVSQPTDDPANYGNPHLDLMKAQLALLGKMSEQLSAIATLLEKDTETEENGGSNPEAPPSGEASKELERIKEIHGRITSIVKDLGI